MKFKTYHAGLTKEQVLVLSLIKQYHLKSSEVFDFIMANRLSNEAKYLKYRSIHEFDYILAGLERKGLLNEVES